MLILSVGPRLNTSAAKRFVRNALWEAEEQGREGGGAQTQGKDQPTEEPATSGEGGAAVKRKRRLSEEETGPESSKRTRL